MESLSGKILGNATGNILTKNDEGL